MEPTEQNYNRWIQYNFNGQCIALWNPQYDDMRMVSSEKLDDIYSLEYQNFHKNMNLCYGINVAGPYHMFILEDPDGNQIEIAGTYQ